MNSARQALEQNKIELESKLDQLSAECSEYRIKYDETGGSRSVTCLGNVVM